MDKGIVLTKGQIDSIIKEAVEQYKKECERIKAMPPRTKVIDECDNGKIREEIIHIDQMPVFLNRIRRMRKLREGLIKTYPIDGAIASVKNMCHLTDSEVYKHNVTNNGVNISLVSFLISPTIDSNTIGEIKKVMETCGYFQMCKPSTENINGTIRIVYTFEPKFSEDVTFLIRENCNLLYHLTTNDVVPKILKKGLTPHKKTEKAKDLFIYPDRVFLMTGNDINKEKLLSFLTIKKVKSERNKEISRKQYYTLLLIDASKIPATTKFYSDPNMGFVIFTYEPIPPTAIVRTVPFNF